MNHSIDNTEQNLQQENTIPLEDLSSLHKSKLDLLNTLISEIDQHISKRESSYEKFQQDIILLQTQINTQIDHFRNLDSPSLTTFQSRMQIFYFQTELRRIEEYNKYWNEIQPLLRERRELMRERLEIERRQRVLAGNV